MRLIDWRRRECKTQGELASLVGCTQGYISYIERADKPQTPNPEFMRRIYLVTRGEVTPNDFHPIEDWDAELTNLHLPLDGAALPLFAAEAETEAMEQAA